MLVENQYAKAGTHHPSFSISIRQCWCFPGGMHFTNFQFNSQLFTTFHNFSSPFFSSLVKLLNAGICISGIRPASGGVNLPKCRHFRTVHRYTGTPHHVLSCESQHTPQWVGHHPTQKNPPQKKKSIHNFSQLFALFTTFHNFSPFFIIFHQPSQFYSGFRVVKTCENLSHFVKICEMHTPREAPNA